jgi:hypothetical protein
VDGKLIENLDSGLEIMYPLEKKMFSSMLASLLFFIILCTCFSLIKRSWKNLISIGRDSSARKRKARNVIIWLNGVKFVGPKVKGGWY